MSGFSPLILQLLIWTTFLHAGTSSDHSNRLLSSRKSSFEFIENKGQVCDQFYRPRHDVIFSGCVRGLTFHMRKDGISYQLLKLPEEMGKGNLSDDLTGKKEDTHLISMYRLDIQWLNANQNPEVLKKYPMPGFNNYYLESCPGGIMNVKSYQEVWLKNIYQNIDLRYYEKDRNLKYDYFVKANGNYKEIKLKIEGAEKIEIEKDGSVVIHTPFGTIVEEAPVVFQEHKILKSRWLLSDSVLTFDIQGVIPGKALLIDPGVRVWGTYYGGTAYDHARECVSDKYDNIYLTGNTQSAGGTIIATSGSHLTTHGGIDDAFLSKFNHNGVRIWATYYGGAGNDYGFGVDTDTLGNVFMCGATSSTNGLVIATSASHQSVMITGGGYQDNGYLVKFNENGVRQWGTYYVSANARDCKVDKAGNIYITGVTPFSNTLTATPGAHQVSLGGNSDGYIAKFSTAGVRLWATYYGGSDYDGAFSCTTDKNNNVYICGSTTSTNVGVMASSGGHLPVSNGMSDGYLAKFSSSGTRLWATYYGSYIDDYGLTCVTDTTGNVFLAGYIIPTGTFTPPLTTTSIVTPGAHQTVWGGGSNEEVFVVKFNNAGIRQWGTLYGGGNSEAVYSCATDKSGNFYFVGYSSTSGGTAIASPGSYQPTHGGSFSDGYFVKFDPNGVRLVGSYYGGTLYDFSYGCHIDRVGALYFSGTTESTNGISTAGSHQPGLTWSNEGFLVKFLDCFVPSTPVNNTSPSNQAVCAGSPATLTASSDGYINWYATASGTAIIGAGPKLMTAPLAAGVYTYYAEALSCTNSVSISRTPITITVSSNATPTITAANGTVCIGDSFTISPSGAATYTYSGGSSVITPTSAVTITVTGTSSAGCTSFQPAIVNVTVHPRPLVSASGGSICSGNSFAIPISGASTYSFSGGPVVSPTTTTSYSITGSNSLGCVSGTPAVITVTVFPLPQISAAGGSVCLGNNFIINPSGAPNYSFSSGSATVTPVTTTSYTINGISAEGCVSLPAILTVTVLPLPQITAPGGSVCAGGSFTIQPSGALTYTFSSGSNVVSPGITTSYSVTGTSSLGCSSATPAIVTVSAFPLPSVSAQTADTLVCAGESVQLYAYGALSYTWNAGQTSSVIVVNPVVTTTYNVTGEDSSGCINSAVVIQQVSDCNSTSEENLIRGDNYKIYPNPTTGIITLEADISGFIKVYNAIGELLYTGASNPGKTLIDISLYPAGIYLITSDHLKIKVIKE
jgi:hypothetical protein